MNFQLTREAYRPPGRQQVDTYSNDGLIVGSEPIKRFIIIEAYDIPSEGKTLTLPTDCGYFLRLNSVFICRLTPTLGIEIASPVGDQGEEQRIPLIPATKGGAVKIHGAIVAPDIPVTIRHNRKGQVIPYLYFVGEPCIVLDTLELK